MSQIAKNTIYWPGIDADIEDFVNRCPTCLVTKPNNKREPLLPHTVPDGPWQKVGADYFDFDGTKYLLLIDYFSKFIYVEEMHTTTAKSTIKKLKTIFSIEGSPNIFFSDNAVFNSAEFQQFSQDWNFDSHGFNPYACQDAYKSFLHTLSQLLSKLDSTYFTKMDTEVVLDTIPDKECATFLERPEKTADKVQQRVSSDSIPTGPEVTSKMHLHGNITSFDKKGQEAITKLFSHLQDAHNHMAQVAQAVVQLSKVSSPEQFTFVLQLAVRPIIQLKIPAHLSAPTELKFEKERLTQEEITEEYCCNLMIP